MATGDNMLIGVKLAAALGCALVGGVLFAFSSFVMAGLARLPSPQGIAAMQSINITAITPSFMIAIFGTALACVYLAGAALRHPGPGTALLLTGSATYLVGMVIVTMAFNVPLNDRLATVDPVRVHAAAVWGQYLRDWTLWNHVRTLASLAASALLMLSTVPRPG